MSYVESLRVFVRVVELGSITSGGRDLRLTPAVASKRIKELEKHLGVRLCNRTTRSLTPTEVGKVFYKKACVALAAIDDADNSAASFSGSPHGVIRVGMPIGVGQKLIAPLIPEFTALYPNISVRLRLTDRKIDIVNDGLDLAFFNGMPHDSSLTMRKIMECRRVLCASPDYLDKHGIPVIPEDLLDGGHNCLLLRYPRSPEYFWMLKTQAGPRKFEVIGQFDADAGEILLDWALAGQGIVNKPVFEVADKLRSGELVEILKDTPAVPTIFGCLYPHKKLQDPKIRVFVDYIIERCKERLQKHVSHLSG